MSWFVNERAMVYPVTALGAVCQRNVATAPPELKATESYCGAGGVSNWVGLVPF